MKASSYKEIMRKDKNNKKLKRTVLSSNVNVQRVKSKDISTSFKFKIRGVHSKVNKLTSCTVLNDEDVDGSYLIFKKRTNGTWELLVSSDVSEFIDDVSCINIYHDRYLKDL